MFCDELSDSPQARDIKSRILVNNKTVVIVWTKREVDVGLSSWCSLVSRQTGLIR